MRLFKTLLCAAALTAFLVPPAHADEWNKLTYFTFSGPIQLPGVTLPAGTYAFKLADVLGDRHVVQVFSKDQKEIFATLMAIPSDRMNPANKPIVMFSETPAGQPAAVKSWFYPGDTIGDEFVYPKSQAMKIAKATHQRVLATTAENMPTKGSEVSNEMKSAKVGRVDENGNMTPENESAKAEPQTPPPAAEPSGTTATSANNAPATAGNAVTNTAKRAAHATKKAARSAKNAVTGNNANNNAVGTSGQQAARRRAQLPKTASSLGLFELLSGLALAGAFGVRRFRVRLAESR